MLEIVNSHICWKAWTATATPKVEEGDIKSRILLSRLAGFLAEDDHTISSIHHRSEIVAYERIDCR